MAGPGAEPGPEPGAGAGPGAEPGPYRATRLVSTERGRAGPGGAAAAGSGALMAPVPALRDERRLCRRDCCRDRAALGDAPCPLPRHLGALGPSYLLS